MTGGASDSWLTAIMANPRFRASTAKCKSLSRRELTVALAAVALIVFTFTYLLSSSDEDSPSFGSQSGYVELTLLRTAKDRGAFCLDGTLPAYHFRKGFGSGSGNWVLHIEGGGWCDTIESCSLRKGTALGSSAYMDQTLFSGILSSDPALNPGDTSDIEIWGRRQGDNGGALASGWNGLLAAATLEKGIIFSKVHPRGVSERVLKTSLTFEVALDFFNWNQVKMRYCDGASFAGHPENEFHNGTNLFFRGQLIWEALMDELLSMGMANARQALLSGCSAGGLATMIHCDDFQKIMPRNANVKCLADAGFFLEEKDISGKPTMRSFYQRVVHLQGVAKSLPKECATKMEPSECMFPRELTKSIKTPLFLVNPAYDFWQIQNVLVPPATASGNWLRCIRNIQSCGPSEMEVLHGFRNALLKSVGEFEKRKDWGMFINSCFIHCQTWMSTWRGPSSPKIDNNTIAESVGDWYFNRKTVKLIDCPFPCNPTCLNMDFGRP